MNIIPQKILKPNQKLNGLKLTFEDEQSFNPADSIISLQSYLENVLSAKGKWNKNSFTVHKPGTIYEYSNVGTALAAFIIEQATGKSFNQFTRNYILEPLKMKGAQHS